jgi:hypothetical protein
MTKESPKIHSTWLTLRQPDNFKRFFEGLCEYLKQNMVTQKIGGSYEYYTCGREHCSLDPKWEPFKHLRTYCWKAKFEFYQVKDFIELHLGRNIICECQILTEEKELKRMRIKTAFGVDFGEPGNRELDVV